MGIFDKVRSVTQQVTGKLDVAKNRREIEKHEQELREDPENIFSLQELSTRYQEVGEDEKAVDLLCRLAEIYKRQFNFDLAFASYRKAERISVSTQRMKVLHSLIALYVQAKRYEESYPYVKQAVEGFLEANQPDAAQAVLDLVPTFGYKEKLYRGELSSLIIIYRSTEPIPSNLTTGPLLPTGPQTGSLPSSNPYTGSLSSSSRPTGHLPASVSLPQPPISQPTSPLPPSSTNWGTGPLTPSSPFQSPMSPTSGPLTPSSPFQPPLANRGTGPLTSSGYSAPLPMSRPTGQFLPKESVTPSQPTGSWTGKHRKLSLEDTETFPNDTLLIVDDEPHTLHLLQMMFRPLGCRILTAANGIEALTCALEHQPTLIEVCSWG